MILAMETLRLGLLVSSLQECLAAYLHESDMMLLVGPNSSSGGKAIQS
jgi:hypothetical protein